MAVELPIVNPEYTQIHRNSKNHVIEFESEDIIAKSIENSPILSSQKF